MFSLTGSPCIRLATTAAALCLPSLAAPPVLGVRWHAPFVSGGGYCTEATSLLGGLAELNVSVQARQHGDSFSQSYVDGLPENTQRLLGAALRAAGPEEDSISVCHSEPGAWHLPPQWPQRWSTSVCPHPGAPYTVGRTMFETDRLPSGWSDRLNAMDAVWVPTQFAIDIFAAAGVRRDKLRVIPEAVETDFFTPTAPPSALLHARICDGASVPGSLPACPYRFMFVGKWEHRKGLDVLLRAYLSEFAPVQQQHAAPVVELYILTSAYHTPGDLNAAVAALIAGELACQPGVSAEDVRAGFASCVIPVLSNDETSQGGAGGPALPVRLLHAVPTTELAGVYTAVDAVVLPTRGEGWGRPHVEAMSAGLPVIATNWSGPTAFLDDAVGFPLAYTGLRPIPDGPFAGHLLAEPDVAHLRSLLRRLVSDPAEGRARGAEARKRMQASFSPRSVAEVVRREVEAVTAAVLARASPPLSRGLSRLRKRREDWAVKEAEKERGATGDSQEL